MQSDSQDAEDRQTSRRPTCAEDVVVIEMLTEVVTNLTHQVRETPERVCLRLR